MDRDRARRLRWRHGACALFFSAQLGGLAGACPAESVALTLRVHVPANTGADEVIAVAGDFQGWRYDDPGCELARGPDGIHTITLAVDSQEFLAFRFHRGSEWTEEVRPDRSRVPARRLRLQGAAVVELTVAAWRDDAAPARTLSGDVTEHSDPAVLDGRRIWVYLPPGYHASTHHYPMLLLLDGQNVFDRTTSFSGEWEVDETCERLIGEGRIEALVVIAVDNAGQRRMDEYTPWPDPERGGGGGEEHLRRLVDEVLPWVRARYRVRDRADQVAFGGSSLGGLMGLYVVATRSDVFGRVAALSPSIPWANEAVLGALRSTGPAPGARLWVDMGTEEHGRSRVADGDEVDDLVGGLRRLVAVLRAGGWGSGQLAVLEDEGARHHESAWAARMEQVLEFLFPPAR